MASIREKALKSGEIVHEIRVSANGKQFVETIHGELTDKKLQKIASDFEAKCRNDLIMTKAEKKEAERKRKLEEASQQTFSQYVEKYLMLKKTNVQFDSYQRVESALKRAIEYFGEYRMIDITKSMITDFCTKENSRLKYSTAMQRWHLLKSVFDMALDEDMIKAQLFTKASKPIKRKNENSDHRDDFLDADNISAVLNALSREPSHYEAVVSFLIYTGCRIGECLAMRWNNIDFGKQTITISENVVEDREEHAERICTPKNGKRRVVPMSDPLKQALQEWRIIQNTRDFQNGVRNPNGYMFTLPTGNRMRLDVTRNYIACNLDKKVNTKTHLHAHIFRHSFITQAYAQGADVHAISKFVGHSTSAITERCYLGNVEDRKNIVAERFVEAISKKAQ